MTAGAENAAPSETESFEPGDDVSQFVFDARIIDGDGGNPAAGTDATTLTIAISEGDLEVRELEYPITDGQFAATLEFQSFSSLTPPSRSS